MKASAKTLISLLKWDIRLLYKYGIITIAFIIAGIYSVSLFFSNTYGMESLIAFLIFSDPVMYSFLFTALILLFEKNSQIHQALAIAPVPLGNYIASKTIAFTLLAVVCSTLILLASHLESISISLFLAAVVLSASLFIFIGIIGVSFVNNFNQFILLMPMVLGPICLPLLNYFNLTHSWLFYLIPTQACLLLFKGSISTIENWQIVYSLGYLLIINFICYKYALIRFKKNILKTARHE